jgi:hypothetical protein
MFSFDFYTALNISHGQPNPHIRVWCFQPNFAVGGKARHLGDNRDVRWMVVMGYRKCALCESAIGSHCNISDNHIV